MTFSIAIVGFRHSHIMTLVKHIGERSDVRLVAVCEEDAEARSRLVASDLCDQVFASYQEMLNSVKCDIIGVGDCYGKRGSRVVEALKRGLHVVGDKPLCTRLEDVEAMTALARDRALRIGCQLDLRDRGNFIALRQVVRAGEIGEVAAISFGGQHPLNFGSRSRWYFEVGQHGGTINDIAIHAFDFIPWITDLEFSTLNCARTWNAGFPQVPHFHNAAQVMLTLSNGAGVLGDVSYLAPDSQGSDWPHYWRTTLWGSEGMAQTSYGAKGVTLYKNGEQAPRTVAAPERSGGYLSDFVDELRGESSGDALTTAAVLRVSRVSLLAQRAADNGTCNLSLTQPSLD